MAASLGDPERQPFLALLSQRPVTPQLFAPTRQKLPLMLQAPAFVASVEPAVQLQVPQSCGQLSADTVQEPPLMLQTPAFLASVPMSVQSQSPQSCGQLFADTVQEPPLLLQTPAFLASVPPGVQLQVPQGTWQGCVLQDWLCVSVGNPGQAPPHASVTVLLLVLLLLCVPPPQLALQAPQLPHCDQDPHSQLLGGAVPDTVRLVAQSPSLQPVLQVLVWVRDWPEHAVEGLGDQEPPQETWVTGGFVREQVPEFDPPCSPSQRHR